VSAPILPSAAPRRPYERRLTLESLGGTGIINPLEACAEPTRATDREGDAESAQTTSSVRGCKYPPTRIAMPPDVAPAGARGRQAAVQEAIELRSFSLQVRHADAGDDFFVS
jgi:hypothetical protein